MIKMDMIRVKGNLYSSDKILVMGVLNIKEMINDFINTTLSRII